ncbi:MAG TPA: cytochrome c [Bryobacteraceae bacterium]|jgi:cytochrome c oxidase cbb3-type subunit 3|nr:cytochrome c [Bryobacteraceae bacterium]
MLFTRKLLLIFVALIALAYEALAQDPDDVARQQSNDAAVSAGKAQFQQTCGFCHGPDGRGTSGPDLIRSSLVNHDVKGNLIGPVVRNGRPEKGMPAFQLSETEIGNIAQFLHAEAKVAASVSQKIPSEYPLAKLLVGNAADGKAYFNGPGKCASCHSVTGDFAHIASKYKPFDLQTKIAFPSGEKPTVEVRDASGNVFKGEQVYADEFLVTIRDKQDWFHTWQRSSVRVEIHDPLSEHEKLLESYTDKNVHDLFAYLETLK